MNQTKPALRLVDDQEQVGPAPIPKRRTTIPLKWIIASLAVACVAAPWLVGPRCPNQIVIATGQSDGAYFRFANEYKKGLAKHGITLDIRQTAGSLENIELLQNGEVSLAMVQGGIGDSSNSEFQSLASLYPEPVWIFFRDEVSIKKISDMKGLRIAIGPEGSGVRSVAMDLLGDNCIANDQTTTFSGESNSHAVGKLKNGEIDAAFFVSTLR